MYAAGKEMSEKAGVVVFSRFILSMSQLITAMLLVRLMPKDAFGLFSFLLLTYATASGIGAFGIPQSLYYFIPGLDTPGRKGFAYQTFAALLGIGILAAVLFVLLSGHVDSLFKMDSAGAYFPYIALFALLDFPVLAVPHLFIALGMASAAAWFNIATSLAQMLSLILPAIAGAGIQMLLISLIAYAALRLLASMVLMRMLFKGTCGRYSMALLNEQMGYSVPLGLGSVVSFLNAQLDKYLISAFFNAAVYAEYCIGAQELPLVTIIPYSVASVIMPKLVELNKAGHTADMLELWHSSIRKVSLIVLPVTVMFLVSADEFISVFFTGNYARAAGPFRIYLVLLLLRVTEYGAVLRAIGDTRSILKASIFVLVVNFSMSFFFVISIGFNGPPLAAVISQFVVLAYVFHRIAKGLKISFSRVFPAGYYFKVLSLCAVAAVPVLLFKLVGFPYPVVMLAMEVGFFTAIFLAAAFLIKFISAEDLRFLKEWVTGKQLRHF